MVADSMLAIMHPCAWLRSVCLLFIALPGLCLAWGHLKDIDEEPRDAFHLFVPVRATHRIDFCVRIAADERADYADGSIAAQVRMALQLWLAAAAALTGEVKVTRVTCEVASLNLLIDVGPDTERPELMAHAGFAPEGYEVVRLNTRNRFADGSTYGLTDFAALARRVQGGRWTLEQLMNQISVAAPMTVGDFSRWAHVPYERAYRSTYPLLLHEIGHSFGLCDTYGNAPELGLATCSARHASTLSIEDQPFSIMQSWRLFHLTDDDRAGIVALFRRDAPAAAIPAIAPAPSAASGF